MPQVSILGIDIAKQLFHIVGMDDTCNAPHLSSGKERRTGAGVMVPFKLPGCLVAQGRV